LFADKRSAIIPKRFVVSRTPVFRFCHSFVILSTGVVQFLV
jgi:hypothetical protein